MNPEKGYNRVTGGSRTGAHFSEEAKERYRSSMKLFFDGNVAYSLADRERTRDYFRRNPKARERVSRQMREYLQTPEGRRFTEADKRAKPVRCVETGEEYPSQSAAEKTTGFAGIHKACSGRQTVSGGYHWEYIREEDREKKSPAESTAGDFTFV